MSDPIASLVAQIAEQLREQGAVSGDSKPSAPVNKPTVTQTPLPSGESFCERALRLCRAVQAQARAQGLRVVTAVCDAGGNPVAMLRDDDAYIASVDIAVNKAFTSVSLKMTTEALGKLAQPGAPLYGIQHTNAGRIVIFGGGVPLMRDGVILGGFGVSGGSAEQDTALAEYAKDIFGKERV